MCSGTSERHPGTGPWSPFLRSEVQQTEELVRSGASRSQLHCEAPGEHITDKPREALWLSILITSCTFTLAHIHLMSEKSMNRQIYSGCKPSNSSSICVFLSFELEWIFTTGEGKKEQVGEGVEELDLESFCEYF